MSGARHWEGQADSWAAWARAPGHDSYWTESGPTFFELLPPAGKRTLDLGCGEGRVARDLKKRAARVLEPGGRLCVCVTHPMRDAGRFAPGDPDAPFVIAGSYFGKQRFAMTVARGGHEVEFRGWSYPLEDYARALEDAGFLIEAVREPPDPDRPIPNFLQLRAVKG